VRVADIVGSLSGGQIQRIAIARALYRKPRILIMDEPTSALDSETEHNIMRSINRISGKLTLIIVSHRMSALKYCSKIYEFKDYNLTKIKT
jgi:ABC-type bacteriocin/lantibiotic exporter with double-glycine peptidase domain